MKNMKWFNNQHILVQILLLLIPVVNWITEVLIRWPVWKQKGGIVRLIVCIVVTLPSGVIIGWLDLIWSLLFKKFFLL